MHRSIKSVFVSAAAVLLSAQASFAASFAGDFSVANGNPNGQWTYGYTGSLAPGYALTKYTASAAGPFESWLGNVGGDGTPVASHNTTGSTFAGGTVAVPAGAATLHPGPGGELSVARYTVPASGSYSLAATFSGYDVVGTTTDVHILHNGVSLFSDFVNGYGVAADKSFAQLISLNAGDTLDFAVGFGSNNWYAYDTTGLAATINPLNDGTAVPTPAAATAGLSLLSTLAVSRRRRQGLR
jgi:hypothetical protein